MFLPACSGIHGVYPLPLPGGETVIYVSAGNTNLIGNGVEVLDRWLYDPTTGKTTLVRSDSNGSNQKITDLFKGLPIPIIP